MKISNAHIFQTKLPLKKPYELSFAKIEHFSSCFIAIETDEGGIGIGEATALPGYSSETHGMIWEVLAQFRSQLISLNETQARKIVDNHFKKLPFAASALGTAIDFAFAPPELPDAFTCPLVFAISAYNQAEKILNDLKTAVNEGFRSIKVKIGRNIEKDLKILPLLFKTNFNNVVFRFDANQGYTYDEAASFINHLIKYDIGRIELLEQPFPPDRWNEMKKLQKSSPIPLMLDESIFSTEHILKANDIGISFVKLKLFKSKGINDLIEKAKIANNRGINVILGNGVATDVANFMEGLVFSSFNNLFHGAFEGNGFAKTDTPLLKNPLKLIDGKALWHKKNRDIFDISFMHH